MQRFTEPLEEGKLKRRQIIALQSQMGMHEDTDGPRGALIEAGLVYYDDLGE